MTTYTVHYASVDGVRITKRATKLSVAQRFAQSWIGRHPDIGSSYAVSFDGIGKVTVEGCSLEDLFPADLFGDMFHTPSTKPAEPAGYHIANSWDGDTMTYYVKFGDRMLSAHWDHASAVTALADHEAHGEQTADAWRARVYR